MPWNLQCNGRSAQSTCAQKLIAFTARNSLTGADPCCGKICRGHAFMHTFCDPTCLGIFSAMADLQGLCVRRNWLLSLPKTSPQELILAVERSAGGHAFMHAFCDPACLEIFSAIADLQGLCMHRNWLLSLPKTPPQELIPAVERSAGDMHSYKVSVTPHVLGSSTQWQICRNYMCTETGCFHSQKLPLRS